MQPVTSPALGRVGGSARRASRPRRRRELGVRRDVAVGTRPASRAGWMLKACATRQCSVWTMSSRGAGSPPPARSRRSSQVGRLLVSPRDTNPRAWVARLVVSTAPTQMDDVDPDLLVPDLVEDSAAAHPQSAEGRAAPGDGRRWAGVGGQVVDDVEDAYEPGRIVGHERLRRRECLVGPDDLVGQAPAPRGEGAGSPSAARASAWVT